MPDDLSSATEAVLAVDLDGTLLNSDLLYETFWAGLSQDVLGTVRRIWAAGASRAGIKKALASVRPDIAQLPYNQEALAYIDAWRADGGRVVMVTAADQSLAQAVADHLGVFDAVHGSDGQHNLKGAAKVALLREQYGEYAYMGDAEADMPVWKAAVRVITVNAPQALQTRAAALGRPVDHLAPGGARWQDWFRALRPHQWLKNLLVFLPMLASHAFTWPVFLQSLGAFIAFSLTASSVYLMNDLLDLSADRAHPRKHKRPLAAGAVPIAQASRLMPGLFLLGLAIAAFLGSAFIGMLLLYYVLTTAYSLHLKQRTIIDIWVLSVLYSMRIMAGAAATGMVPSVWLMAFSIFFFFSLAAVKRQAELVDISEHDALATRRRGYHPEDTLLIAAMAISAGYLSVLVMALYIRTPFVERLYGYPSALLGICLVLLYWISRIVMVTHRGHMHDDPLVFALRDRVSQICVALSGLFFTLATLLPSGP